MRSLHFECLLPRQYQSPIITSFLYPNHPEFSFSRFYEELKSREFVIYPGKISTYDTFRIGNIGDINPDDIKQLLKAVKHSMFWL